MEHLLRFLVLESGVMNIFQCIFTQVKEKVFPWFYVFDFAILFTFFIVHITLYASKITWYPKLRCVMIWTSPKKCILLLLAIICISNNHVFYHNYNQVKIKNIRDLWIYSWNSSLKQVVSVKLWSFAKINSTFNIDIPEIYFKL